jgi:hypothetical protein
MTLKLVLDRFEEDIAVCLDFNDKSHLIPREILSGVKVNDIFNIEFDGNTYHSPKLLENETEEAKESISKRMNRLFKIAKNRRFPK